MKTIDCNGVMLSKRQIKDAIKAVEQTIAEYRDTRKQRYSKKYDTCCKLCVFMKKLNSRCYVCKYCPLIIATQYSCGQYNRDLDHFDLLIPPMIMIRHKNNCNQPKYIARADYLEETVLKYFTNKLEEFDK